MVQNYVSIKRCLVLFSEGHVRMYLPLGFKWSSSLTFYRWTLPIGKNIPLELSHTRQIPRK